MNKKETLFEEEQFEVVERELHKVMDYFFEKALLGETVYYSEFNQKLAILRQKKKRKYACEAGRRSLTVDEQGNYYACQNMIPYKQTKLGNVDTGVSEEKKYLYQSKDLALLNECKKCKIRNLCAGGCEVERRSANVKSKQQMCRLSHIEWKSFLYLYALVKEIKKN